jgi:multiple sugar transport system permease protein
MIVPVVEMFRISTYQWPGLIRPKTQIGLEHYVHMVDDARLHKAIRNTGVHLAVMMFVTLPLSFMFGYFLAQRTRGYRLFRVIFFSPVMLSISALTMMFLGLYLPDGIINYLLRQVGLESWTRVWLANKETALGAVIFADMWAAIGFYSVLFFAAISGIPKELFEAAEIDGAGYWGKLWRIAFPISRDFVGVVMMLIYIWTLATSAQTVLLLTRGRPAGSSMTVSYYLYEQAFIVDRLGYSQALGVCIFIVGLVGMLVIRLATRKRF